MHIHALLLSTISVAHTAGDDEAGISRRQRAKARAKRMNESSDPSVIQREVFIGNVPIATRASTLKSHIIQRVLHAALKRSALGASATVGLTAESDVAGLKTAAQGAGVLPADDPVVESVRFRSIPIKAVAVAPGSDYATMIKAAVAQGSVHGLEAGTSGAGAAKPVGSSKPAAAVSEDAQAILDALPSDDSEEEDSEASDSEPEAAAAATPGVPSASAGLPTGVIPTMNAYVKFSSSAWAKACLALNNTEFHGRHLRVTRAGAKGTHGTSAAAPAKCLFLGQLPWGTDEEAVRALIVQHDVAPSMIDYVRVPKDRSTGRTKGIAYVALKDAKVVAALRKVLNGASFNGRKIQAQKCKAPATSSTDMPAVPAKRDAKPGQKRRAADRDADDDADGESRRVKRGARAPWMGATPGSALHQRARKLGKSAPGEGAGRTRKDKRVEAKLSSKSVLKRRGADRGTRGRGSGPSKRGRK